MIERKIITGLIVSDAYIEKVSPAWQPRLLTSGTAQFIGQWCIDHFKEFGKAPKRDIETIYFEKLRTGEINKETAEDIADILEGLSEEYDEEFNLDFYIRKTNTYLHERSLQLFSEKVKELTEAGELDAAEQIASSYSPILAEIRPYLDLSEPDVLLRVENAFLSLLEPILKYPGILGEFWNDQFTRGSFVALLAPEKRGKTFWLLDMAFRARKQGNKVAFFQAGDMSEGQQLRRLSSYMTKKPFNEKYTGISYVPVKDCVRNQLDTCNKRERECDFGAFSGAGFTEKSLKSDIELEGLIEAYKNEPTYKPCYNCKEWQYKSLGVPWLKEVEIDSVVEVNEAKQKIKEFFIDYKRKFKLSTHPNRTLSVNGIKNILQQWWREEGFVPDVIVIDYADIMINTGTKEFRHQQNEIWMGLRALSQEYNCLVITATQADADSYKQNTLSLSNYSEDKRKYAHVTAMYGLNQDKKGREKKIGVMRINEIVLREGSFDTTSSVTVLQSLNQGRPFLGSYK